MRARAPSSHLPVTLAVSLVTLGLPSNARAQAWGPETPLTSGGGDVWGEGIASAGATLHLIYGSGEIRYRRSLDEGGTWSVSNFIANGTIHFTDPIVADGKDVWIAISGSTARGTVGRHGTPPRS